MEVLTPNRLKYLLQKIKTQIQPKVQQFTDYGSNAPTSFTTRALTIASVPLSAPGYYLVHGTVGIGSSYGDKIGIGFHVSSKFLSNGEDPRFVSSSNGAKIGQDLQVVGVVNVGEDASYVNLRIFKKDATTKVNFGPVFLTATLIGK